MDSQEAQKKDLEFERRGSRAVVRTVHTLVGSLNGGDK